MAQSVTTAFSGPEPAVLFALYLLPTGGWLRPLMLGVDMSLPDIIEGFRQRPSSWIGSARPSFSALAGLIAGYAEAHAELRGAQAESPLPREFGFFIQRALNARHPSQKDGAGHAWTSMIISEAPDEAAALDLFYELWDAYKSQSKS